MVRVNFNLFCLIVDIVCFHASNVIDYLIACSLLADGNILMEDEEISRPKDTGNNKPMLPNGPPNDSHGIGMTRPRSDTNLPSDNDAGQIQKKQRSSSVQFDLGDEIQDKTTDA